jgi:hypothetical protein
MGCKDSSAYILDQTMCLFDISKDARAGILRTVLDEPEPCPERDCETYKIVHQLDLPLEPGPCDPDPRRRNGRLYSCDLTRPQPRPAGPGLPRRHFHLGGPGLPRQRHAVRYHQRGNPPRADLRAFLPEM